MIGKTISHYRIVEELGRGGMGVVYKTHDEKLDRPVALKVLKPEFVGDEDRRQRFLREARSAAAVTHPYRASICEAGEADGTLFIAMEFVEGATLRSFLAKGPIPIPDAQRCATEIAEGLATAHQSNLVHRDLKPDNVMLASNGHVKILDFGLAKLVETRDEATTLSMTAAETPHALTTEGAILGTPAYMSPEQARGESVDSKSDIFSFGSTAYEMLTGKAAFRGPTHQDSLASILKDEPVPLQELNPKVSHELDHIINRCLHKKPEERYNDTRDLVAALRDLQDVATAPSPSQPILVQPRRGWRRLVALLTTLVVTVTLFILQPWKPHQRTDEPSAPETPEHPNWILVADFEGPPGDPNLAVAARELVRASLEQSGVVTPIPRSGVRTGLRLAMKPDTTQVVAEVARELAYRATARAYVEGRVDRMLGGYSIVLRALDSEAGHVVTTVNDVAESDDAFISTLNELSKRLRERLGEEEAAIQTTRELRLAMTPSLPAYRMFVDADALNRKGKYEESNHIIRRALKLDPDFARAWRLMALNYRNTGEADSAEVAFNEALSRPERLTEVQRLVIEALVSHTIRFDYATALKRYDVLVEKEPFRSGFHHNRGVVLWKLGRYDEALDAYNRAAETRLFGPAIQNTFSQVTTLMNLGRNDEARQLVPTLNGWRGQIAELRLAIAATDWVAAESLAVSYRNDPNLRKSMRLRVDPALAAVKTARGQAKAAADILKSLVEMNDFYCGVLLQLFLVTGRSPEFACDSVCTDSTTVTLVVQGIQAALRGGQDSARGCLDAVATMPDVEQQRYAADIRALEACIALAGSRRQDGIRYLESAMTQGREPRALGRLTMRWLVAETYENAADLEKAAQAYELVLSPVRLADGELSQWGIVVPFAHQRLVLLYARMGRVEDARRHWEMFEKTFTDPDPELVPMVEEARRALAEAEAKS
jgi:serine/threonine protein kinase/tetratricopeptide (TPR) repeat protein